MNCATVDELAAAYALSAVSPDEERAISEHLATCDQPHAEARDLIGAATAVPAALEPVAPSGELRARLMATVATTPQDHAVPAALRPDPPPAPTAQEAARRPWWTLSWVPTAVAAVALAAAVGLGAWNINLSQQLADREAVLRAVASADAAHAVTGSAGSGWVIETDGRAIFLAEGMASLPADKLYELWLIGPDEVPVAVGTVGETSGVVLADLERPLGSAVTFAITVESSRVEAPTSEPVMVATLGT